MTPRSPSDLLHRRLTGATFRGRWVSVEDMKRDASWSTADTRTALDLLVDQGRAERNGDVYRGIPTLAVVRSSTDAHPR